MNITFRTQLLGGITDFCTETALSGATPEVLVDLVVRLVRYQEEGVKMNPQVYLTDNIDLLISMLPEGEKRPLSVTTADPDGIEEMLKICAPLATGEWRIFGQPSQEGMAFGVFRGSGNPISVGVDDVVLTEQDDVIVVKAHQVAEECVQISSSKGISHHIFFNHRREQSPPPLQHIDDLVQSMLRRLPASEKEAVLGFLTRKLIAALSKSHGCILAVTNMRRAPKVLSHDAVLLEDPIDFPGIVRQMKKEGPGGMMPQVIERNAELLEGMICSDGITLFDERGRVLGYRCFVRVPQARRVIGGARRRAFATLQSCVGRGISAAFMQSQDGWTDFEGKTNG